jgi:hypothetical protein
VCEALCVPAEGRAELELTAGPSSQDAALAAAEARVPKKTVLGQASALAIKSVRREDGAGRRRVIVDVAAPVGARVALFAEGPTPDWALPVPKAVDGAPSGSQRFAFALDGAPPRSRSPQSRGASQSRSSPVSTNSPGALIWAPAGPAAGSASGTARLTTTVQPQARGREPCPSKSAIDCPRRNFAS